MKYKGLDVSATMPKALYSAQLSITNQEGYKKDSTSFLQNHYVVLNSFKYKLTGYPVLKIVEIITGIRVDAVMARGKTYRIYDRTLHSKLLHIIVQMKLVPKNHFNLLTMKRGRPHTVTYCPIIAGDDVGTVNVMIRFDYSTFPSKNNDVEIEVPFIVDQLPENDLVTVFARSYRKCERTGLDYPPCFVCSKTDKEVWKCGVCLKVVYCSKECQRKGWKEHK